MATLPKQLRRNFAWDWGQEIAEHVRFTIKTEIPVNLGDAQCLWQRGTPENTTGLLHQYVPWSMDFSEPSQEDLNAVARGLKTRPTETLGR